MLVRRSCLLLALTLPALANDPPLDPSRVLEDYVRRPQQAYGWKALNEEQQPGGVALHRLELVSQTWQGRPWKHRLIVAAPAPAQGQRARAGHAILLITGGGEGRTLPIITALAGQVGVPIAAVFDVPNQPLFEKEAGRGLSEDALIAYTFAKFIETGDPTWPLLLPMTRSAVAAMDALGEWSEQRVQAGGWPHGKLTRFVTTGASKRGWTTWLTGVADPRVMGIAPIVYDNLNIAEQIPHQYRSFGAPSASIGDYTELGLTSLGLVKEPPPHVRALLEVVDPYSYAPRLTLPKMGLFGTNDSYWPLDAVNLYRGALPGEFFCHYVPNAGHQAGLSVISAVAGFFDHVTGRIPALPQVRLTVIPGRKTARVEVTGPTPPRAVKLWWSEASARDFRQSKWERIDTAARDAAWEATIPAAALEGAGHAAFLGEVELQDSAGASFLVHSPVQVWERARQ